MLKLIGLAGKAGTGKDTVGYYLEDVYGYQPLAFADPLKQGLRNIFGFDESQLWGDLKEREIDYLGKSPRQLMQSLGDWGRDINPSLWLNLVDHEIRCIEATTFDGPRIVITDVRYENEAAFVRERGGVIIHIDRLDAEPVNDHSSENGISGNAATDVCIRNDGSLNDLYCKVADVMDRLADPVIVGATGHG